MQESTAKKVFLFTCLAFFSFGTLWASIGPLLSQFAKNNGVTLAVIGGIYSAIFLGAITSQLVFGPFTDRIGHLRMLAFSLIDISITAVAVNLSRWLPLTFVCSFLLGLGQGTTNLCGNVLVGQLFPKKSVTYVNMLNLFWGIGATIGPLLISGSISLWQTGSVAACFSAFLVFVSGSFLVIRFFNVKTSPQPQSTSDPHKHISITPFLVCMGLLGLVYVGLENGMSGWATTYIQKTTSVKLELAALVTALFWLAVTLSRLMGTLLGSRLTARQMMSICLGICLIGALVFIAGYGNSLLSIAAIFLIGLGLGAFYPTSIAVVTSTFSEAPGQAGTLFTLMGSIGGVFLPWLQGLVMQQKGIRTGTFFIAVLVVLLILAFALTQRFVKKTA